ATLVERFDRDKDGLLSPGEVPRRFRVTLSRRLSGVGPNLGPVVVRRDGPPAPRPAVGPVWFQKMDRNRDGVVSRREFLGTHDDFPRIDTNGVVLLSSTLPHTSAT